jgi:phosphohistidine swiveling domain-containing protein
MTAQTQAAPQLIPVPDDFPIEFRDGAERLFWQQDRMHFPGQVGILEAALIAEAIAHGASHSMRKYSLPVRAMHSRAIHGYVYNAMEPVIARPEEMEELGRRAEEKLMPVLGGLRELWNDEYLPEIERHLERMGSINLRLASLPTLMAHLDETYESMMRLWRIHFEIVLPAYMAISEFDEFYRDLFEDSDQFDSYRLLQGFPNKTTEIGHDLFRLSREALQSPDVTAVLEREAAADVIDRLSETKDGRRFLAALDRHLQAYGHRGSTWGLSHPSFIEDPTPVIKTLKDYIGQTDSADPARELKILAREREEAIAEARGRLQAYPAPMAAQFEAMLEAAQVALVLTEDHNFYIDFYAADLARQVIVEVGRRLAGYGAMDRTDDIFHLTLDEIRSAARAHAHVNLRPVLAERRAELERYAEVVPPPLLGTLPPGPPPDTPVSRSMMKFFGMPPAPADEPGVISGASGSAGAIAGTARVVRSLEDAARIKPGEILVAETTAPPWTPLFAVVAAVVTDTGGILSHCAVVAREYGIPSVVGTGVATAVIQDGDTIEVDGDAGVVRIVKR